MVKWFPQTRKLDAFAPRGGNLRSPFVCAFTFRQPVAEPGRGIPPASVCAKTNGRDDSHPYLGRGGRLFAASHATFDCSNCNHLCFRGSDSGNCALAIWCALKSVSRLGRALKLRFVHSKTCRYSEMRSFHGPHLFSPKYRRPWPS